MSAHLIVPIPALPSVVDALVMLFHVKVVEHRVLSCRAANVRFYNGALRQCLATSLFRGDIQLLAIPFLSLGRALGCMHLVDDWGLVNARCAFSARPSCFYGHASLSQNIFSLYACSQIPSPPAAR